jgi:hypothetical protein
MADAFGASGDDIDAKAEIWGENPAFSNYIAHSAISQAIAGEFDQPVVGVNQK